MNAEINLTEKRPSLHDHPALDDAYQQGYLAGWKEAKAAREETFGRFRLWHLGAAAVLGAILGGLLI